MSKVQEMAIVVACVSLTGVAANELVGGADGVAPVVAEEVPFEEEEVAVGSVEEEVVDEGPLEIEFSTSGSLAGPSEVFGRIEVSPRAGAVGDVELLLEPGAGVRIDDVIDARGKIEGRVAKIALGDVSSRTTVIVRLFADDAGAELRPVVSYRDATSDLKSIDQVGSWPISGVSQKADLLVDVRRGYTAHALAEGESLMEEGDLQDALELVRSAQAANVETGMTMRVAGKLRAEQRDLEELEARIREAMKPKKKIVRKIQAPKIEIMHLN